LKLDLNFVRSQFPAFTEDTHEGWAFFENAGGSYPCRQVVDRLHDFYLRLKVQPYYPNPISQAGGAAMDESYRKLAGYLNVSADEVHLGPSTTQNTYVLARAMRPFWRKDGEIIVTNQDHEANSGAWRKLGDTGMVIREWQVDPATGLLDPADLDALLNERTCLLAFPHCSNIVGHMNPVSTIAGKAREVGALTVCDGVAAAPHGLPDVGALGVDIYLFSLYKTWGPHLGCMTVRRDLLDRMENQGHFFNAHHPHKKLVPAGPDHAQIASAAGVIDYLDALCVHHHIEGNAAERGHRLHELFIPQERQLLDTLLDWIRGREDLRLIGPETTRDRAPTVAVVPLRKPMSDLLPVLSRRRIMAGSGHFYAARLLEALGIPLDSGVLRFSFLHYTSPAEMDQLLSALGEALD